jgi:Rne/Rng family ribonuclease
MVSKELVVSQNRHETKVAILEDGQLVEVYFQRANEYSLAGSIHKGRVTRVLPGMQSAFVDLGLERDCFLYVSDFFEEHGDEYDRVGGAPVERDERSSDRSTERGGDRDRGRGRDRDRERREPAPAVERVETAPVAEVLHLGDGIEAQPIEMPSAGAAPQGPRDDRRGGRRSRRRRKDRGFPDSKYAAAGDTPQAAEPVEAESVPVVEEIAEPVAEAVTAPAVTPAVADFLLLPGESLAKYRRNPPAAAPAPAPPPEPIPVLELQAEVERAVEETVEDVLDRVDAMEEMEASAPAEVDPEETEQEEEAEVEGEETEEGSENEVEGEAETEGGAEPEAGAEATPEAGPDGEGIEPARMPQSLTATLRAQGGRYPHRMSRRMRRRGRGPVGPEGAEGAAPAEAVPAVVEVRAAAPERSGDRGERTGERARPPLPSIADLLKEGQEIIVQIAKEPLGAKGARITSHIALPGRYVVYMPTVEHLGVSRKISTEEERLRLKKILQRHREGVQGGFIMRTAGEGRSEDDIASDMSYLANLWLDIKQKAEKRRAPALLHHDVEVVQRLLRDQLTEGFKAVWVDNEELYESVLHTVERIQPSLLSRVKLYTRVEPIFDAFGISGELEKALRPKVWLKSGGYIVINQTEALVAIDVNTGKYVGKSNRLEDTIVKTNLEAVKEIVRQVRLRDLGGIIVVDFIDMEERKNRQKVMQALEETMRMDKAPYKILQFNDFGLVAVTRKRVKQSLERALCSPCPQCEGAGYVKSVQTVIGEILAQAQKYAKVVDGETCVLRIHPDVAKTIKSNENHYLEELEETLKRPVLVKPDPLLHPEKFDLT